MPSELVLHRAQCSSINGMPPGGKYWTHDPIKVAADTEQELLEFINPVGSPRRCRMWGPCRNEWHRSH